VLGSLALGAVGIVLLALAGDQLVLGSSRVAGRLRMSPIVIGVVLIGFGTSAPEMLVSGLAAARGELGIAVGNLVGSNVLNLTLVLGLAGLLGPITVRSTVLRREGPLAVAAVAVFAVVLLLRLDRLTGAVLAVLFVVALVALLRASRAGGADPLAADVTEFLAEEPAVPLAGGSAVPLAEEPAVPLAGGSAVPLAEEPAVPLAGGSAPAAPAPARHSTATEAVRAVAGLIGVLVAAQLVVGNAVDIATRLGLPSAFVGFTLVAVGTSLPELVTAIQAQRRGETDLLIGNLFGSNLFNSLAGGAVVALTVGPDPRFHLVLGLLAVMVGISVLAWILLWHGYRASRKDAVVLLVVYAACLPLLL